MKISRLGLALIAHFEGFRECPYYCPAGVATIGFGTTIYTDGTNVTMDDDCITEEEAIHQLETNVNDVYGECVDEAITVEASQCQFDAMVSLCYNIGCGAFSGSTLVAEFNSGDLDGAYLEFDSWIYAGGEVSDGLVKRRNIEQALFELC